MKEDEMISYDIIGDIHGQDAKLEGLLANLGYVSTGTSYQPPQGRQAVFLGDLIDRGPGQIRVLEIVRSMVEEGSALCIMGNHELNAIGFISRSGIGDKDFFRPNIPKNRAQHAEFLEQIVEGSSLHKSTIAWFRTLPVCLNLGGIRVVHGCWDDEAFITLQQGGWSAGVALNDELLEDIYRKEADGSESPMMRARKLLTCGLEIPLPYGRAIEDKAGNKHEEVRVANWRHWAQEFQQIALVPKGQEAQLRDMEWPADLVISAIEGSPIFVGHHWFTGHPTIESPKLACLDWSAAREGPLVAYRWDGEAELSNDKLVWVGKE
jgi:hypothetical protein